MLSFAKNERGIRLLCAAQLSLPIFALVFFFSRSEIVQTLTALSWAIFSAFALIAFLFEKAEEEEGF